MARVCQMVTKPPVRVAPTRAVNNKKMRALKLSRFHITLPDHRRNIPISQNLCYHKNRRIALALWDRMMAAPMFLYTGMPSQEMTVEFSKLAITFRSGSQRPRGS